MNYSVWPDKSKEQITVEEGFIAVRIFMENYWKLRGSEPGILGDLILAVTLHDDGSPFDEAEWGDWLAAVQSAKAINEKN